ncbi:MAG: hypothetical protein ACK4TN_05580 [Brevinematales bacterium]
MDKRFWMAFAGFVVFVGGGTFYFLWARWQRIKLLRMLMGLPKPERKLWYRLRQRGYEVVSYRPVEKVRIITPEEPLDVILQVEWLVRWQKKMWAVVRKPFLWGVRECLQSFFPALVLYDVKGVLWYDEESGMLLPWYLDGEEE